MTHDYTHCPGELFIDNKPEPCPLRMACHRYVLHVDASQLYSDVANQGVPLSYVAPAYDAEKKTCEFYIEHVINP